MPWILRRDYTLTDDSSGAQFARTCYYLERRSGTPISTPDAAQAMAFVTRSAAEQFARANLRDRGFYPEQVTPIARDFERSVNGRFGDLRARANG